MIHLTLSSTELVEPAQGTICLKKWGPTNAIPILGYPRCDPAGAGFSRKTRLEA
jgi:hypothetical protein